MGRLLFRAFESTSVARQWARPSADVSTGGWTASAGDDLYAMIDEATAVDGDYIISGASPVMDTATVALDSLSSPSTGVVTIWVRGMFV